MSFNLTFIKRIAACMFFLGLTNMLVARQSEDVVLQTAGGPVKGSLLVPAGQGPVPVVLIIAGSGPTDRDGNNPMMKNNGLKMLADSLLAGGVASLRYDKRGIAASAPAAPKEEELRFGTYIEDAEGWIRQLRTDKRFSRLIVAGHSEGSLIGMVAAREAKADAFISIAGPGQSADKLLKDQLKAQPPGVAEICFPIIDSLAAGKQVTEVNPMLNSLFRPSVQPYLISWFAYDPQQEIAALTVPVLILQGTTDLQVPVAEADRLQAANPKARLQLIDSMNHVLKTSAADRMANLATYNNPELPVPPALTGAILGFVKGLR